MPKKPSGLNPAYPMLWTPARKRALDLVFEGRRTWAEIAVECGVAERTLKYWRDHPDFRAELEKMRADLVASLDGTAYVRKEQRIIALSQMAEDARQRYEKRPWLREVRTARDGSKTVTVRYNRDAYEAFREALIDIAAELGDRKQQVNVTGSIDVVALAAEADARLGALLAADAALPLLGGPDAGAEG